MISCAKLETQLPKTFPYMKLYVYSRPSTIPVSNIMYVSVTTQAYSVSHGKFPNKVYEYASHRVPPFCKHEVTGSKHKEVCYGRKSTTPLPALEHLTAALEKMVYPMMHGMLVDHSPRDWGTKRTDPHVELPKINVLK
jgi:hypothetical protein